MSAAEPDGDEPRSNEDSFSYASDMDTSEPKPGLLDLSDDVLLCILSHCGAQDLKALGFTCPRLGALILDRTLWRVFTERDTPMSQKRLRWFLRRTLNDNTVSLHCSGYAVEDHDCMNFTNRVRMWATRKESKKSEKNQCDDDNTVWEPNKPCGQWCRGPRFTMSAQLMTTLKQRCPSLSRLALDYCNIDCMTTQLGQFPPTLRYLSLRATKCYNLSLDRSFMFRIHERLPLLEELDVSHCEWLDGSLLMPLSKLPKLSKLLARDCRKLTEFVAYASLAARYGFRALKVLDVSGCPVADSEVSAFGWVPRLEELYLSATAPPPPPPPPAPWPELHAWETQEPAYLNTEPIESEPETEPTPEDEPTHPNQPTDHIHPEPVTNVLTISFNRNATTNQVENTIIRHRIENGSVKRYIDGRWVEVPAAQAHDIQNFGHIRRRPHFHPHCHREQFSSSEHSASNSEQSDSNSQRSNSSNENLDSNNENCVSNSEQTGSNNQQSGSSNEHSNKNSEHSAINNEQWGNSIEQSNKKSEHSANNNEQSGSSNEQSNINNGQSFSNSENSSNSQPSGSNTEQSLSNSEHSDSHCEQSGNNDRSNSISNSYNDQSSSSSMQSSSNSTQSSSSKGEQSNGTLESNSGAVNMLRSSLRQVIKYNKALLICESNRKRSADSDSSDEDNSIPIKIFNVTRGVNVGASTSNSENEERPQKYVKFRRNQPPVVVENAAAANARQWELLRLRQNYVPAGNQLMCMYRLPATDNFPAALVTDAAIKRYGNSDEEDRNFIQIGPDGIVMRGVRENGERPNKSRLKVLVCTGYMNITNASLEHLVTAAPELRLVDFRGTGVTESGVAAFKALRPDCEVKCGVIEQ